MPPRPYPRCVTSPVRGRGVGDVAGVLLAPGAGGTRDHHTLVALEAALAPLPVRRVDLPRHPSSAAPAAHDLAEAFAADLGVPTGRLVVGGRSYGGRMCSMAVARGLVVAGLVVLSYPLYPPGHPERARTEHLPDVAAPVLAVSGERDPYGTPDELRTAFATLPGPWQLVLVPGGHAPADAPVVAAVTAWLDGSLRRAGSKARPTSP